MRRQANSRSENIPEDRPEPEADEAGLSLAACERIPGGAGVLAAKGSHNWKHRGGRVPWRNIGPLLWDAWIAQAPPAERQLAPWLEELVSLVRRWGEAQGKGAADFDFAAGIRAACLNGLKRQKALRYEESLLLDAMESLREGAPEDLAARVKMMRAPVTRRAKG
jgi:hypothetical protein